MTTASMLNQIDAALANLCACGCGAPLPLGGLSAWFAGQDCQQRWRQAQTTNPGGVLGRADAGLEAVQAGRVSPDGKVHAGLCATGGTCCAASLTMAEVITRLSDDGSGDPAILAYNGIYPWELCRRCFPAHVHEAVARHHLGNAGNGGASR